jgi:protocatechuate 3,4-dioxygenase beta subunit
VTTDDAGRFEISGVPLGAAVLVVKKTGWCQAGADLLALLQALRPFGADQTAAVDPVAPSGAGFVVAAQGDVVERTIRMTRAVLLCGHVIGPAGSPVPGARVTAKSAPKAASGFAKTRADDAGGGGDPSRLTDSEGRFEIAVPVAAGTVRLEATAPGFRRATSDDVEIGGAAPPPDVELTLHAGATIEGRVTDASGAPVEGAAVSWREPAIFEEDSFIQSLVEFGRKGDDRGRTTTDAGGEYRLALVDPYASSITLDVRDGKHVAVRRDKLEVRDGQTLRVDVTLESGLSITGRVSRIDGRPASNAWVEVHREDLSAQGRDASGDDSVTESDGRFRVSSLAAGKYRLIGHAQGAADGAPVVVDAGAEGVEIRLAARLPIAGVVKFKDGRPVVGAQVAASGSAGAGGADVKRHEARTGADGAFRLDDVDPGEYELSVTAGPTTTDSEFRGTSVGEVAAGETDVVIEVESALTISGEVLGPNGAPAASGFVRCAPASAADAESERQIEATIRAGRFVLKGLTPGKYVLSVALRGFSAPTCTAEAGATDVTLRLTKNGAIKGRVLLPDGKRAPYADIALDDKDMASSSNMSDAEGAFKVADVAPGLHRVTASASEHGGHYVGEIRDVRVVEGRATEGVEIRLTKRD